LEVEGQVRNPESVRERPGAEDGLGRTAAALAVALLVGPELQRHRDHFVALARTEVGGDGAVDAATEADEHTIRVRYGEGCVARRRVGERTVEGIGGEVRRVELAGREAAELLCDLRG
jgi:hypothetical protein